MEKQTPTWLPNLCFSFSDNLFYFFSIWIILSHSFKYRPIIALGGWGWGVGAEGRRSYIFVSLCKFLLKRKIYMKYYIIFNDDIIYPICDSINTCSINQNDSVKAWWQLRSKLLKKYLYYLWWLKWFYFICNFFF